jgi:large subunit ribosomal protein L2
MKQIYIPKPTTPSKRNLVMLHNKKHLTKKPFIKNQIIGLKNSSGRNNSGKITIRHKGGGHKQKYRKINFYRKNNSTNIVCSIEYDPNRKSFIASIFDLITLKFSYIIAPKNLKIGDIVKSGKNAGPYTGHTTKISKIPEGIYIHNISPKEKKEAQLSRSAGTFSLIKEKSNSWARISLSSGEERLLSLNCLATIGIVSNSLYFITKLGKAGQSRWLNKRPSVRGVAMNPVDHPNGGGEGKQSGKAMTPWGKSTQQGKKKSKNKFIILKTINNETF